MRKKFSDLLTTDVLGHALSLILAISFFVAVSNIDILQGYLSTIINILFPFILAFTLAYILNSPIVWFKEKIFYKLNSKSAMSLSIITVYVIFLILLNALLVAIIPQVAKTISIISTSLPDFLIAIEQEIVGFFENNDLGADLEMQIQAMWLEFVVYATDFALEFIPNLLNFSISLGVVTINLLTAFIASLYMLFGKDRLIFQVKKLVFAYTNPRYSHKIMEVARRSNKIFSGFIVGKLIDSMIIGVLCFIGMLFIYEPFAVLIAVVVGVTNMIPFFGPFIGAIPCAFILLMISPVTTFAFIIFIIVLQQIDGNIIGPRILGNSTGLSPIWVLVAIIIGNGLFGIIGMVIGVPTFAVLYSLLSENISTRLKEKNVTVSGQNFEIFIEDEEDSNESE